MPKTFRSFRRHLAHAMCGLLLPAAAHAVDVRPVIAPDGRAMFELRFLQLDDYPPEYRPHWELSESQKSRMVEAMSRWAQTLLTPPDARVGVIDVITADYPTAFANSHSIMSDRGLVSRLQAALQGIPDDPSYPPDFAHATITLGTYDMGQGQHEPSQQPIESTGFDLATIAFHELAHGLGLMSNIQGALDDELRQDRTRPVFAPVPSLWNSLLRDDHGRPGEPGAPVLCAACNTPEQDGAFDVRQDRGYLTGPHLSEVLGHAMPGLPVRMLYPNGSLDDNNMSHLELANSLMSHQFFRGYTGFMEAELALMQDLGYQLDRRRLYGRSVYDSGLTLDNHDGFHARNADGTAYLPGTYSTATLGMGLHVYGSHNRIRQSADLLTQGTGAVGARLDGQENQLTIPAGVRVHGDGLNGAGVHIAYGRDHTLTVAGDVRGRGDNGVGIRVDFGNNAFSNARMVRGSYLLCDGDIDLDPCLQPWQSNRPIPDELAGPLLRRLDITGTVAGRQAAIAASANSLLGDVHLMRGAHIEGDIRSDYRQTDDQGQLRLTRVILGRLPDAQGRATEQADSDFRFQYGGRLLGDNLSLRVAGGISVLDGQHQLHDVRVAPGATLAGLGQYHITGAGQAFVNDGRLQPGDRATPLRVLGDYRQGASGALAADFDSQGAHHQLAVDGTATLGGTLALRALPDWYAPGWQLGAGALLAAHHLQGQFAHTDVQLASPTLQARVNPGNASVSLWRAPDAYARLGATTAARQAGGALDRLVIDAPEPLHRLYRWMDFSAPDGAQASALLTQLAPTLYAAWAAGQHDTLRGIGDMLTREQYAATQAGAAGWHAFATPFGSQSRRRLDDGTAFRHRSHGLLLGVEHTPAHTAWTFGLHAAWSEQQLRPGDPLAGDSRNRLWQLGLHGRYVPDARQGVYLHAQLGVGSVRARLNRTVAHADWRTASQARWVSRTLHAQAVAGYQWAWTPRVSVGPVLGLDYAWLRQPGLTESGDAATRLALQGQHHGSLRGSLGVRLQWHAPTDQPGRWQGHVQLTRDQTLAGRRYHQQAAFAAQPAVTFGTTHALAGRGAWRLQAGLAHDNGRWRLGAQVEGQLAQHNQHQLAGQVSVGWRF